MISAVTAPGVIPRDDRAWPRGAVVTSVVVALVAVAIGAALAVAAAGRSRLLVTAVVAGFVLTFAVGVVLYRAGIRQWLLGYPYPPALTLASLGLMLAAFGVLALADGAVGFAMLVGLVGGLAVPNIWAIRAARKNRPQVDEAEAAAARERANDAQETGAYRGARATQTAPVGRALRTAVAVERRKAVAWVIASVLVAVVCVALDAAEPTLFGVVAYGGLSSVWALRRLWGISLANLDFRKAATPPRRAYVVLLNDPAPRSVRPLLGIWSREPVVREGRMPKPERVYRCDGEHVALECFQGSVVVHEAWVDTAPRSWSRPRWVAADGGIALPHRRSVFGRWYLGTLIRAERPDPPEPLTIREPRPEDEVIVEFDGDGGSFLGALGSSLAQLGGVALLVSLLT